MVKALTLSVPEDLSRELERRARSRQMQPDEMALALLTAGLRTDRWRETPLDAAVKAIVADLSEAAQTGEDALKTSLVLTATDKLIALSQQRPTEAGPWSEIAVLLVDVLRSYRRTVWSSQALNALAEVAARLSTTTLRRQDVEWAIERLHGAALDTLPPIPDEQWEINDVVLEI